LKDAKDTAIAALVKEEKELQDKQNLEDKADADSALEEAKKAAAGLKGKLDDAEADKEKFAKDKADAEEQMARYDKYRKEAKTNDEYMKMQAKYEEAKAEFEAAKKGEDKADADQKKYQTEYDTAAAAEKTKLDAKTNAWKKAGFDTTDPSFNKPAGDDKSAGGKTGGKDSGAAGQTGDQKGDQKQSGKDSGAAGGSKDSGKP